MDTFFKCLLDPFKVNMVLGLAMALMLSLGGMGAFTSTVVYPTVGALVFAMVAFNAVVNMVFKQYQGSIIG